MTGQSPAPPASEPADGFVDLFGRRFYRIADYDRLPPFFMTVVGSGDPWLFVSSTGGLTAGRVSPETALFPYYTDDKVSESAGTTGGLSLLRVARGADEPVLWQPFTAFGLEPEHVVRTLFKDPLGSTLVFQEQRTDLGLTLRVIWQTCRRFGIVRSVQLANTGPQHCAVELLDGFVNVLPAGLDQATQNRLSNLINAYKRSEVDPDTGLGLYSLSSRLTDLAEPSECLAANVVWQVGLDSVQHLASTSQVRNFHVGLPLVAERDVRGLRGAYLVHTELSLTAGSSREWHVVGDVEQDAAEVAQLRDLLRRPEQLADALAEDLRADREDLLGIVASTDGLQSTGDELASAHHAANVLFNDMRGGVPVDGYRLTAADLRAFIDARSPATAQRCADFLAELPDTLTISDLAQRARSSADPDLRRLSLEYLPFTFSRRHGDPSRPWNKFAIVLQDEHGDPRLNYEGNWRDIFQNWEALAWSFPEFVESMVAVFLDATTADGYNPYRISRDGIDWEVPEPDDPWANIGYWSDHQIIYLLKLLETSALFHPGRLEELRGAEVFTHGDVPYKIDDYEQIVADPYDTITYDEQHAERIAERVEQDGADGRLVHGVDGELVRVTLSEKLLLLLLAKVVNLVPDGGVWMNTQRPEWNDANNALVGRGLSVVTLAQMRRYVDFIARLLTEDARVTDELADLLDQVAGALEAHAADLEQGFDDAARRAFMDDLGAIGSAYRQRVYRGFSGDRTLVPVQQVQRLLTLVESYIEHSLRDNRRSDGLYHSYNTIELGEGTATIRRLPEMLEGQVAALTSGQLSADEALELLRGMRHGPLYRADQHSYTLYPDKELAGFLDRNRIPAARAAQLPLLQALVDAGDRSVVVADVHGDLHFAAHIRNSRDVEAALDRLAADPEFAEQVAAGGDEVLAAFEEVFQHAEFTGRSGTFFAYEGLGSIYWHMVSKLLLSVQETLERAVDQGEPAATIDALNQAYEDVRSGLGYSKPASVYGAFPIDPYSHTPAGHGAKQPGMTGQVKEEVLTRLGELGLRVEAGQIRIRPVQLRAEEFHATTVTFEYVDVEGSRASLELVPGSLGFTFCDVPIVYRRGTQLSAEVQLADGSRVPCRDARIDAELSASIFERRGQVRQVDVAIPMGSDPAQG